MKNDAKVILLHHSTGNCVWKGGVPEWIADHNEKNGTQYDIVEQVFPKKEPYGWKNYPYDYWNIWVKNAGAEPFQEEPTLEILTKQYDVIIFKHCFPVSSVEADEAEADIASNKRTTANYKLQYEALKKKLREFPDTRFIVWTGAAVVKEKTSEENAKRARDFFGWVKSEWDEKGDNIFVWDFDALETEGGLYLKAEHSAGEGNSHPNDAFSAKAAPLLGRRVVDVIEGRGDEAAMTGEAD